MTEPGPKADGLVATDLERRSLSELREASGEVDGPMERHCVRCFLLVERLAAKRGVAFDREVALSAAFLHDIGLYDSVSSGGVYTDEGGELARALFAEAGESPSARRSSPTRAPTTMRSATSRAAVPRSSCCASPTGSRSAAERSAPACPARRSATSSRRSPGTVSTRAWLRSSAMR